MILASVALFCATTLGLVWMLLHRPTPPKPSPLRSVLDDRLLDYVVVTMKNGTTFGGVLYVEDAGAVVLAKAEQYMGDRTRTPADGEIILLRGDIDFIQRP